MKLTIHELKNIIKELPQYKDRLNESLYIDYNPLYKEHRMRTYVFNPLNTLYVELDHLGEVVGIEVI